MALKDQSYGLEVGTRHTYSTCVCRLALKAQGGYTLKSSGFLTDVQKQNIFSFKTQLSLSSSAHANCRNGGDAKAHIPHSSDTHDSSPPYLKKQKMSQGLLWKNNHSIGCDLAVSMAIQAFLHCDTFRKWKFPLVS